MMDIAAIELGIKEIVVSCLNLDDVTLEDIAVESPLFAEDGVGLDSIDALEIGVQVGRRFGVKLSGNAAENREHFYSVQTLAKYVASQMGGE